ncbi:MAG TPA: cysteine desulfurase family protein [Candidatus Paceibacterota bacterium]|nr:cysteine desulfurase family protein [Candidatus Paceibacterota bacterium]
MQKQRLYFDYAASTPVAPEVEAAMRPYFGSSYFENSPARHARRRAGVAGWGNAGSLHSFGQEAIAALDESRETIANAIGAGFREIIFTGSATEANNLAIRGIAKRIKYQVSSIKRPRIIVSAIEHESILETARDLEKEGIEVVYIPVSKNGIVDLKKLKESLNERTILVSVMYANNEIGTIQPIAEIAEIVRDFRNSKLQKTNTKQNPNNKNSKVWNLGTGIWNLPAEYPLVHTDAVQAFQFLDCNVKNLGVDLMTLSSHKIYGPKGIGILYMRDLGFRNKDLRNENGKFINHKSYILNPIITGGGQEFGMRSGTENVPLAVGFAKAVSLAVKMRGAEAKRISSLRDYFWKELKKIYPAAKRNGDQKKVLPNFLNVYFPDFEAADLLTGFDLAGLGVSAGSACSARSSEPSYIIEALRAGAKQSSRSIRITLGRPTSKKDIDTALKIIKNYIKVAKYRHKPA